MAVTMFAFLLVCQFVRGHDWWLLLGAAFFGWPIAWLLRWLAKDDPLKISINLEAVKQPLTWEPE
jgi:hypothetical protein